MQIQSQQPRLQSMSFYSLTFSSFYIS
jgi:hypothetical protein